jgi:hypothetical protein
MLCFIPSDDEPGFLQIRYIGTPAFDRLFIPRNLLVQTWIREGYLVGLM